LITQERLRACAAELQKISDMMLEVAQLRDAVQEADGQGATPLSDFTCTPRATD
jgi:hypothetical protein